ncbi:hypothetical protein [Neosynechococcus sphagnicola]|uniref:hypothetical protein n=1 Tax=Neosynechococcus sphagnicola TaxID=1501145 RepID=UPI0012DFF964|nr:hypothetical protein [Neosynechococcus sphagnicola]
MAKPYIFQVQQAPCQRSRLTLKSWISLAIAFLGILQQVLGKLPMQKPSGSIT